MLGDDLICAYIAIAIASGLAGLWAGSARHAGDRGFIAGLLLGPLGVIASLGFDNRPLCDRCGGRINLIGVAKRLPQICPHCGDAIGQD